MNMRAIALRAGVWSATILLTSVLVSPVLAQNGPTPAGGPRHTFAVEGQRFLMDGKPYQIISGEMHYPRVPREYWRDRLRKAHAMGLNTITTYAFWNLHEPKPSVYDFSGQNDIAEYIREAQAEGLNVILRPGPYVCAEWELGGYPAWLLKDRDVILRSNEPKYSAAAHAWFARLAQEIKPLLLKNGGPIIAVQIENEYGSFGDDQAYLATVKQQLLDTGLGDALLYTSNPVKDLVKGSLPHVPTVINFGTGDAERSFAKLAELRPDDPKMAGEYWAGWFDKWGEEHHATDGQKEADEFRWMLAHGYSVSLYMFHGGTTFGWMNGADSHTGKDYHPDVTSYDYDAPLNERGEPTYKFELFRKIIADTTHAPALALPSIAPAAEFPIAATGLTASLWSNLPSPTHTKNLLTFEDLDQSYGYVLYRTQLSAGDGGPLVVTGLHDYALIYVDQHLVGTLDRRLGGTTVEIPRQAGASTLDILVENTGRVNYSRIIRTERSGITGDVRLGGRSPEAWDIYSLPMDDLSHLRFKAEPCVGPCFVQSKMEVSKTADTFLDTRGLHKGQMWLNDRNLGRFWSAAGPEYALYTPAPWLHRGSNTIVYLDLLTDGNDRLTTTKKAIFGAVKSTREAQ